MENFFKNKLSFVSFNVREVIKLLPTFGLLLCLCPYGVRPEKFSILNMVVGRP